MNDYKKIKIKQDANIRLFCEGQLLHFIALAILTFLVLSSFEMPGFKKGYFLGISTSIWVLFSIANAIIHQIYVWFCWRAELSGKLLSKWLGPNSFKMYSVLFIILIVLRPISIFSLGWANRGTLEINLWASYSISLVLLVFAIYCMYSIAHYFSFQRAFGIDHFDKTFQSEPLVRQGIFRWTPNAMYVFGFFALWIPAFLFQSAAAIIVAGFSHVYIWVHFFATEKPDMLRIYGK